MRGLNCNFTIKDGKFSLSEGTDRATDAIWMYSIFDKNRVYVPNYGANLVSLLQKPIGILVSNRTILLGTLKKGITKYVPNVVLKNIDMGYTKTNRKHLYLKVEYSIKGEEDKPTEVIFI